MTTRIIEKNIYVGNIHNLTEKINQLVIQRVKKIFENDQIKHDRLTISKISGEIYISKKIKMKIGDYMINRNGYTFSGSCTIIGKTEDIEHVVFIRETTIKRVFRYCDNH